jgi:GYF domain 2
MRRMSWYYERGGESIGPVTEAVFGGLLADGSIGPATLVWREGMANWQPHGQMQPSPGGIAPPAIPLDAGAPTASCQVCGGVFPADQVVNIAGATVCAACKPIRLQMLHEGSSVLAGGLWRKGKTLVAAKDAQFPDRCIHCGGTTDLRRLKKRLYWHHPAVYLTILAGLLIYVIVALVVRKRADIEISICAADRKRRMIKIALAWLLFIGFLASFPVLGAYRAPEWMWFLPPLLLIASVVLALLARLVYAAKIDEKQVWLRGICAGYLADLPEWTGH